MDKNRSLYEVLGVLPTAEVAEIRGAFTQQLASLENYAATLDSEELASRKQLLRIAAGTLLDSSSRLAYDAKLTETGRLSPLQGGAVPSSMPARAHMPAPAHGELSLSLEPLVAGAGDSVKLRADALSLRAESLSLRADAMLLQAGQRGLARAEAEDGGNSPSAWINVLSSGPLLRVLMFLIVMAAVAFGISRCAIQAPIQAQTANTQAMERAALQEYFQTHGVRPANMAELELLETERRRRENDQRNSKQDGELAKREEKAFEEAARRDARATSEQLRRDEERQQQELRQEQRDQEREVRDRKEADRMAEQQRIQRLEEQWRKTLQR